MEFMQITYKIARHDGSVWREVTGFAFETPGWPDFHACVRLGNRMKSNDDSLFDNWIIDHYETGFAISLAGSFEEQEAAPPALQRLLNEIGRERVEEVLRTYGVI